MNRRMSWPSNEHERHWLVNERPKGEEGQGQNISPTWRLVYKLPGERDLHRELYSTEQHVRRDFMRERWMRREVIREAQTDAFVLWLSERHSEERDRDADRDALVKLCEFRVLQGREGEKRVAGTRERLLGTDAVAK